MAKSVEKKRIRAAGQIAVDFVNAKTTDDACIGLFKNIQNYMDFSQDFYEHFEKRFIKLDEFFGTLSEAEKELYHLYNDERKNEEPPYKIRSWQIPFKYSKLADDKNDFQTDDGNDLHGHISEAIKAYDKVWKTKQNREAIKFKNAIEAIKLKGGINAEREKQIKKILYISKDSRGKMHNFMKFQKEHLQRILREISGAENLSNVNLIDDFINEYNSKYRTVIEISPKGLIEIQKPFDENFFLGPSSYPYKGEFLSNDAPFFTFLSYCLITFLMDSDNIRKLRQCNCCEGFYISKTLTESRFCCQCSPGSCP